MVGELQPRRSHEGEFGGEEELLEADNHGEASSGDIAADSKEVARREVTRALPHAEEEMKDGDFPNAVDGEEGELVDPVNLPEDEDNLAVPRESTVHPSNVEK